MCQGRKGEISKEKPEMQLLQTKKCPTLQSWNTNTESQAMTTPKQQAATPLQGQKRKYHNLSETLEKISYLRLKHGQQTRISVGLNLQETMD